MDAIQKELPHENGDAKAQGSVSSDATGKKGLFDFQNYKLTKFVKETVIKNSLFKLQRLPKI